MNGPVPIGFVIVIVGFWAIWFATDAFRMYVLPRIAHRPVYCGVAKCSVTLSPLTVGGEACVGTPGVLAFGFAIALNVATTSSGPNDEPSLNFTLWRMVSSR